MHQGVRTLSGGSKGLLRQLWDMGRVVYGWRNPKGNCSQSWNLSSEPC